MMFTKQQVEDVLRVMDYHYSFVIMMNLGVDALSSADVDLLKSFGINIKDYDNLFPVYNQMFYLGKLASLLGEQQLRGIDFKDLQQHINSGQYISLTSQEKRQLDVSKRKTYTHLKGLANKSKDYMSDLILEKEKILRTEYEKVIQGELERGVVDRKTTQSIVSDIGHHMKDWQRDWGRIVETEMNNIYQEGKAEEMLDRYGEDVLVYKDVYPKACRHCIRLYLKGGIGGEPRVFKLIELMANGDNLNKKVDNWKAIVGSTHPFCRCDLRRLPKGYKWNEEKGRFTLDKKTIEGLSYKGIVKISFGDKILTINN